jgi:hypothetical protein
MSYRIDLTGQRFNQLVALEYITTNRWLFLCDCGNKKVITSPNVKSGGIVSCGCHRERNRVKHGLTNHPLYYIHKNMLTRCYKVNSQDYFWYGQRGIIVCDEWRNNFQSFYDWAIQYGYSQSLTLDRIDTDGNYGPDNCRWLDRLGQANNRRNTKKITYNNQEYTLTELVDLIGKVNRRIAYGRINRFGWDPIEAITTPSLPIGFRRATVNVL